MWSGCAEAREGGESEGVEVQGVGGMVEEMKDIYGADTGRGVEGKGATKG